MDYDFRQFMKDTVKVERNQQTGTSESGTPILSLVPVIESYKCNIQNDNSQVIMPATGETTITRKIVSGPLADIREKDIITDLATGKKYKVTDASMRKLIGHMEIKMESGVV